MPTNKILQHDDNQRVGVWGFAAAEFYRTGKGKPPSISGAALSGEVKARIDDNRWLADCPDVTCGGAMLVSEREPYFLCLECGSSENDGKWFTVIFPADKNDIEAELLKRDESVGRNLALSLGGMRSWSPVDIPELGITAQNVADLKEENVKLGVK